MELGIVIAIVGSAIAIVGVVIAMMFSVRQESNALRNDTKEDRKDLIFLHRETEQSFNEHRKEMAQISKNIEMAVIAIQNEIKDFHYKLLEIEKARK